MHHPSYGFPREPINTHNHPPQNQHQQQQKQFTVGHDESYCSQHGLLYPHNLNHHTVSPLTHQLFWHHQGNQQPFLPLQRQGGEGEEDERLVFRQREEVGPGPSFFGVNFKLGLNANSTSNANAVANLVPGPDGNHLDSHALQGIPPSWHLTEGATISTKESFWTPLNANNTKHGNGNEGQEIPEEMKEFYYKHLHSQKIEERCKDLEGKYRLFGELEAIYGLAKIGEVQANQTGSISALTRDNSPTNAGLSMPLPDTRPCQVVAANNHGNIGVEQGSDNSIGEEALLRRKREKRKRKLKEKLSSMAGFFEHLVKRVIDHQEMLYRKFLEVVQRMDAEGKEREKEWRRQETAEYNRDATERAREEALALSREARIISYIGKLTGQSVCFPPRQTTDLLLQNEAEEEPAAKELASTNNHSQGRWPRAEVEALINVRSSIKSRLQEPGFKGSVWEEVSSLMCSMGYQRSAKKCKEKWENINKYFKKAKESNTKRRSQQSKTCSYFNQLDELYSRTLTNCPNSSSGITSAMFHCSEVGRSFQDITELEDGFIAVGQENEISPELLGTPGLESDGVNDENLECGGRIHEEEEEHHEDNGEDHQEQMNQDVDLGGGGADSGHG